VFSQILGFGEYGFPESHAASFALITYVTAWLRHHHIAAFTCSLLNAQPMGFYSPATIVDDGKRHGVGMRAIDVQHSRWNCTLERGDTGFAVRMGYRYVKGLGEREKARFEAFPGPWPDLETFVRTTQLDQRALVALGEAGALDFNDLLLLTVQLFERFPEVLGWYRRRFQYVLVDEYQDTNRVQYTLIHQLAGEHRNLCVVGDPDQSIYAWRGADVRNILDFEADFPGAVVVRLEQNYRSTQTILDAAQAVIRNNRERVEKKILDHGDVIRVGVVSHQFRHHSVWNAIVKGWF